jgi:hypothetical protein
MVSQIQRSGGSMFAQLFDNHPQFCAHPFEIHMGYPEKWDWIDFSLKESFENWFEKLYEIKLDHFTEIGGYKKPGNNQFAKNELLPFDYSKDYHKSVFLEHLRSMPNLNNRDVFDAYFDGFFRSWKNDTSENPKYITGFAPRLNMYKDNAERMLRDYPDGFMITLARHPVSWFASWIYQDKRFEENAEQSFRQLESDWLLSLKRSVELKSKFPKQIISLTYEQVVRNPERVMKYIANVVGIDYSPSLLIPSYAGLDVYPNSSFDEANKGVIDRSKERIESVDPSYIELINQKMLPAYDIYKSLVDIDQS